MPKIHRVDQARETVDLHAPWWSPKQDEKDGRYLERVTVYRQMLQGDQEFVNSRVFAGLKKPAKGDGGIPFDRALLARTRVYLFQAMIVEMTDEDGKPLPMDTHSFSRPVVREDTIRGMENQDADWIEQQLTALQEPLVPILPEDVEEAERNIAREHPDTDRHDPRFLSEDRFRPLIEGHLAGRSG